jgi:hypothetical protein
VAAVVAHHRVLEIGEAPAVGRDAQVSGLIGQALGRAHRPFDLRSALLRRKARHRELGAVAAPVGGRHPGEDLLGRPARERRAT